VKLKLQPAVFVAIGGLLAVTVLARFLLWLIPPPHRPLEYMISGTAATTVALGTVFAGLVIRKGC
jgi:hypothetical protein